MSDMHGDLPVFDEKVDVVGIAGDIVPLEVQNDTVNLLFGLQESLFRGQKT